MDWLTINDHLDVDQLAKSINKFVPMRLKALKRAIDYHGVDGLYGIAYERVDDSGTDDFYSAYNADSVSYNIVFRIPDAPFLDFKDHALGVHGMNVGVVYEKGSPMKKRLTRLGLSLVKAEDVNLVVHDMIAANIYAKHLISDRKFSDGRRFIPLYDREFPYIPVPPML